MRTAKQAAAAVTAVTAAAAIPAALAATPASASEAPALLDVHAVRLMPPARHLVTKIISESAARTYTIASGDTLSGIAQRVCGDEAAWPSIWHQNQAEIPDPDMVYPGQVLRFTCGELTQLAADSTPASPGPGYTEASGPWPGGAFGNCVVQRESGGNAQVMNASGHYGLYQFSASTWAEYGGNPADFGHASVAEQERVFMNALAAGGQSNWAPYDGC